MTTGELMNGPPLLEVDGLKVYFPIITGWMRKVRGYVRAVDDVSFELRPGETLALVGESGCGKTTTGRAILQAVEPTGGEITLTTRDGERLPTIGAEHDTLSLIRQEIQLIFQDPFASLNPRMTIFDIVADPLRVNGMAKGREMEDRVTEILRLVGLAPEYMRRYPHAFSGGQRQRIGIARSLIMNPRPGGGRRAGVRARRVRTVPDTQPDAEDLQEQFNLAYLFISHDLSVVQYISHRVAVMYVGKIVEVATTDDLFTAPKHPYTQALLSSVPIPNPEVSARGTALEGEVADPADPPTGCYFHPRCPFAEEICRISEPPLTEVAPGHYSSCHFADQIDLPGVPE